VTYTSSTGWTNNYLFTHTDLNTYFGANLESLRDQHDFNTVVGLASGNTSVGTTVVVTLSWSTALRNVGSGWSSASPTRITIPATARYRLWGVVRWSGNASGYRRVRYFVNGSTVAQEAAWLPTPSAAIGARLNFVQDSSFTSGDYLEFQVFHNAGAAINVVGSSIGTNTRVGVRRIGDQ